MNWFKPDLKKMSESKKWQMMLIPFNFKVFESEAATQLRSRSICFFDRKRVLIQELFLGFINM